MPHTHGNKKNYGGELRQWTHSGLLRHMLRAHAFSPTNGLSSEEERFRVLKQDHNILHSFRTEPHNHNAKTGAPWSREGIISHLSSKHADALRDEGLTRLGLYDYNTDYLRGMHNRAHGGTQLKSSGTKQAPFWKLENPDARRAVVVATLVIAALAVFIFVAAANSPQ